MFRKYIALLSILMVITGCSSEDDVINLRIGHALDEQHSVHQAMVYMGERLSYYSDNQMQISLYPNAQLGSEREMLELLQIGSLAMTKVSAAAIEGFVPEMKIYGVPYLFRDNKHRWAVLQSDIGKTILGATDKAHLTGMGYYDAGSRSFYTSKQRVETPSDLSGQKIRVMQSPSAVNMVNTMGGSATPISFGELYTALQQGVVDGAENNPPSFFLSRHYEISNYYVLDEHTSVPDVIVASKHIFENLTPQQQEWLQLAVDDSIELQKRLWSELEERSLNEVKAAGVEVIYPDKQPFVDSVQSLYKSHEGTIIGEFIKQIKAMEQEVPNE
ncbi:TRAP transporter substrate-binding protein [Glaciecola sp. HTCC2999]|jgi:tripartite ATP-independent transporter DctP family solute receptor|uniref:TRAP transporter substrate-binding protein n=1 Tax=Glaciecola sp. HTCC2999 TaxID=455436 RepID=UPI0000E0E26B|nr:TRAP transporter substrate-binding protein [Glaciecola sp. HTCC2999]